MSPSTRLAAYPNTRICSWRTRMGYGPARFEVSVAERAKSSSSGSPKHGDEIYEVIIRAPVRLLLAIDLENPVEHARQRSTFPADDFRDEAVNAVDSLFQREALEHVVLAHGEMNRVQRSEIVAVLRPGPEGRNC
jgi:hypothetical protein